MRGYMAWTEWVLDVRNRRMLRNKIFPTSSKIRFLGDYFLCDPNVKEPLNNSFREHFIHSYFRMVYLITASNSSGSCLGEIVATA